MTVSRNVSAFRERVAIMVPTYTAIHQRLLAQRGRASDFTCSDPECEEQAKDWAYTNDDPDQLIEKVRGKTKTYSADLEYYVPLCRSHHLHLDRGKDLSDVCPSGHSRDLYEKKRSDGRRYCGECNRLNTARWKAAQR